MLNEGQLWHSNLAMVESVSGTAVDATQILVCFANALAAGERGGKGKDVERGPALAVKPGRGGGNVTARHTLTKTFILSNVTVYSEVDSAINTAPLHTPFPHSPALRQGLW